MTSHFLSTGQKIEKFCFDDGFSALVTSSVCRSEVELKTNLQGWGHESQNTLFFITYLEHTLGVSDGKSIYGKNVTVLGIRGHEPISCLVFLQH